MTSTKAWQRHGCYTLGSQQYFDMPLNKAPLGCYDDWNALDHFDPTMDTRRMFGHFMYLRSAYNALQDGFDLVQHGNWTYVLQRPGSNGTVTEVGLWTASRAGIPGVQTLAGNHTGPIWLLYTNEDSTKSYTFDCKKDLWISTPYVSGTTVRNLFAPYEKYQLQDSLSSFYNNGQAPWQGCLPTITLEGYGFKALVPEAEWVPPRPALTRFLPGHDARILVEPGEINATSLDITLEFSVEMNCDSVTNSLSLNVSSSGKGGIPSIDRNSIKCSSMISPIAVSVPGSATSAWFWSAQIQNLPDGVLALTLKNPEALNGTVTTGVSLIHSTSVLTIDDLQSFTDY
jgi:alpha-1,3-glucan synthase